MWKIMWQEHLLANKIDFIWVNIDFVYLYAQFNTQLTKIGNFFGSSTSVFH